jgi:hypothetical protein
MFDNPQNPRHPTRWHVRTYGLFAANPFGLKPFDKTAKASGDLKLAPGERVTFRYRFVFHAGDEQAAEDRRPLPAVCTAVSKARRPGLI